MVVFYIEVERSEYPQGLSVLEACYSALYESKNSHNKEDNSGGNRPGFTCLGCDANHAASRGEKEHNIGDHGPLGTAKINRKDLVNN